MNFALFTHSILLPSLQNLARWLAAPQPQRARTGLHPLQSPWSPRVRTAPRFTPKLVATHAIYTGATAKNANKDKPLRIVRVMEAGQSSASVGRMVISGRMKDVCAELDRLVEREAALL
jgi:hypothetical protein